MVNYWQRQSTNGYLTERVAASEAPSFFRALLMRTVAKILIRAGNARLDCLRLKMSSRHVTVPSQTVPDPTSVWSERFRCRGAVPSFIASGLQNDMDSDQSGPPRRWQCKIQLASVSLRAHSALKISCLLPIAPLIKSAGSEGNHDMMPASAGSGQNRRIQRGDHHDIVL